MQLKSNLQLKFKTKIKHEVQMQRQNRTYDSNLNQNRIYSSNSSPKTKILQEKSADIVQMKKNPKYNPIND